MGTHTAKRGVAVHARPAGILVDNEIHQAAAFQQSHVFARIDAQIRLLVASLFLHHVSHSVLRLRAVLLPDLQRLVQNLFNARAHHRGMSADACRKIRL